MKKNNFIGFKPKVSQVLKPADHQTGSRKSVSRDKSRSAQMPGKRISKNGKIYYEYRKNRSDLGLKNL